MTSVDQVEQELRDLLTKTRAKGIVLICAGGIVLDDDGKIYGQCLMSAFAGNTDYGLYVQKAAAELSISPEAVWEIIYGWDATHGHGKWSALGTRLRNEFKPINPSEAIKRMRESKPTGGTE